MKSDTTLDCIILVAGMCLGFGIGHITHKYEERAAKQEEAKKVIKTARLQRLQAIEDRLDHLEGKQKVITYMDIYGTTNWIYVPITGSNWVYTNWGVSNIYWLVNTNKQ